MAETGLNQNYFRDYDPQTGRYIQSDPIGLRGGVNTYAYAGGNPLSLIDLLGLACREGERVLRTERFKDLSGRFELAEFEFPLFGPVHIEPGLSPELGRGGIKPRFGPSITWDFVYAVRAQDEIRTGYIQTKFFSRKYYCKSDDPCNSKEWVELRDDGFEQISPFVSETEWRFIGVVPSGYHTSMP